MPKSNDHRKDKIVDNLLFAFHRVDPSGQCSGCDEVHSEESGSCYQLNLK